jgi:hypothetical protein
MTAEDFQNTSHQEIFKAAVQSLSQDHIEPVSFALEHIPYPLLEQAETILYKSADIDPHQDFVLEDMIRTVLRLRQEQLRISNNQIRFLMEDTQTADQENISQYNQAMQQNSQILFRIQKALASPQIRTNNL